MTPRQIKLRSVVRWAFAIVVTLAVLALIGLAGTIQLESIQ